HSFVAAITSSAALPAVDAGAKRPGRMRVVVAVGGAGDWRVFRNSVAVACASDHPAAARASAASLVGRTSMGIATWTADWASRVPTLQRIIVAAGAESVRSQAVITDKALNDIGLPITSAQPRCSPDACGLLQRKLERTFS